jgi:hypothetical protein
MMDIWGSTMNEYDLQHLKLMRDLLQRYGSGKINLSNLFNLMASLEGLLPLLENVDEEWKDAFHSQLFDLDIEYAVALDCEQAALNSGALEHVSHTIECLTRLIEAAIRFLVPPATYAAWYMRGTVADFPVEEVFNVFVSEGFSLTLPGSEQVRIWDKTGDKLIPQAQFYELTRKQAYTCFTCHWLGGTSTCAVSFKDDLMEMRFDLEDLCRRDIVRIIRLLLELYFHFVPEGRSVGIVAALGHYESEIDALTDRDWRKILKKEKPIPVYPDLVLVPQQVGEKILSGTPGYCNKGCQLGIEGISDWFDVPVQILPWDGHLLAVAVVQVPFKTRSGVVVQATGDRMKNLDQEMNFQTSDGRTVRIVDAYILPEDLAWLMRRREEQQHQG